MNLREQRFWRNELKESFKAIGHVTRVESHDTAVGIPDINIKTPKGPEWWIELKVVDRKGYIHLRPSQKVWHANRRRNNGNVMILTKWEDVYMINTYPYPGPQENKAEIWKSCATYTWQPDINWVHFMEILNHDI